MVNLRKRYGPFNPFWSAEHIGAIVWLTVLALVVVGVILASTGRLHSNGSQPAPAGERTPDTCEVWQTSC